VAARNSTIRSWLDLARLAEESATEDWVFRGESLAGEPLRPSAGRAPLGPRTPRHLCFDVNDERAALERFKSDALPYLDRTPPSDHHLEWLAIAQHHGMRTRLLDWSESLLIAAFFAVEAGGARGGATIYGVKGLPSVVAGDDPFEIREISVYRPSRLTARIAPQLSTFTVHPDPTADFRADRRLRRWRVPGRRNCWQIKLVLDACGVNYANIFPDVSGLARHIQWRYKWKLPQSRVGAKKPVTPPPATPPRSHSRRRARRSA
jgi:hypothetical protein